MSEIELGTLYEFNKQAMNTQPSQSWQEIEQTYNAVVDWISYKEDKYFMLLCREKYDFTVFKRTSTDLHKLLTELQEVLNSRGNVVAINYVHNRDYFEFWVKTFNEDTKQTEVFMYVLFEADGWVVEA